MSAASETPALEPEDEARAAFYALIAQLFYAPPDQAVLAQILNARVFEGEQTPLAGCWHELVESCRTAFPAHLENEHTALFIGTGKAEVTPYLSHYAVERNTDNPLVRLRKQLDEWGLARQERATEPEDHLSSVCEVMRLAIATQHRSVDEQKSFFDRFVYPGGIAFCSAVLASPKSNFYRPVARLATEFLQLERAAFDMP
jgi:TorA maturation chaperone TorD